MPRGVIRARRFFWFGQRETADEKASTRWWEAGMEKRAANRHQAGIFGERIADVPHPPHPRPRYAVFCPVAQSRFASSGAADNLHSSIPSFLPHRSFEALLKKKHKKRLKERTQELPNYFRL